MRKLVTLRDISSIDPIPNADSIERATIGGWEVVVKKGEFKAGNSCVYFEIDSLLPILDPRFEFLVKGGHKVRQDGHEYIKLKTIKLRGQLSQGLALPLSAFPEIVNCPIEAPRFNESDSLYSVDFSDLIGVVLHEPPIPAQLKGQVKGYFPSFIKKTDQERVQNLPDIFDGINAEALYEVTTKLDGTSCTVFYHEGEVGVCSRNLQITQSDDNTMWKLASETGLVTALSRSGKSIAIQGELIGPGIQGNNEDLKAAELRVFDVWDIKTQRYLSKWDRAHTLGFLRGIGDATILEVPFIGFVDLKSFDMTSILKFAEGPSLNPSRHREGVVFKRVDGGTSFKAISNTYLLRDKS